MRAPGIAEFPYVHATVAILSISSAEASNVPFSKNTCLSGAYSSSQIKNTAQTPKNRHLSPARVKVLWFPDHGEWRVLLRDTATANPLFETQLAAGAVASSKKYYVPFEIEVWSQGKEVIRHRLDLTDRNVLEHLPVGTLGDTLGVAKFERQHRCRLTPVSRSAKAAAGAIIDQ